MLPEADPNKKYALSPTATCDRRDGEPYFCGFVAPMEKDSGNFG
jgi:hypothetical protein